MFSRFRHKAIEPLPLTPLPDTAIAPVRLPVPVPAIPPQEGWSHQVSDTLDATWTAGTEIGGRLADGAMVAAGTAATQLGHGLGWASAGLARVGSGILGGVVVTPAMVASRTAATVAEAAIVQPVRALRRTLLTIVFTVCGSAVVIALCAAFGMYHFHASMVPVIPPSQPTVIVMPPTAPAAGAAPTLVTAMADPAPAPVAPASVAATIAAPTAVIVASAAVIGKVAGARKGRARAKRQRDVVSGRQRGPAEAFARDPAN